MHLQQQCRQRTAADMLACDRCLCPCRAQSDKIFSQQSSLGKAQEEVRALRGQVESRTAQQEVIEAEIRRQVEEYGRLKRQLVNQEELQVGRKAWWVNSMFVIQQLSY